MADSTYRFRSALGGYHKGDVLGFIEKVASEHRSEVLEYEKTIADMNRTISGIETFVLFTEPSLTHVSSSHVRELLRYKHDVSNFIPKGMTLPK